MKNLANLLFAFLIASSGFAQEADGWKLARNQDGIKVYLRNASGLGTKEVLGLTRVSATLGALVSMVKDPENHPKWVYASKQAQFLKKIGDFEWIYYNISEAPWPIRNRDLITRVKLDQDPDSYSVRIDSEGWPDYIPSNMKLVRIARLKSAWVFTPKSNGIIDIRFELSIDLGGDLPAWLINLAIDKGPFNTLLNMAKVVKSERYRNKVLPFIREKKFSITKTNSYENQYYRSKWTYWQQSLPGTHSKGASG